VRILALSIDVGEEVLTILRTFLSSPRCENIGDCFFFSAVGSVTSAKFRTRRRSPGLADESVLHALESAKDGTSYAIESITARFGGDRVQPCLHAVFVLPPVEGEAAGESVGGELVEAFVGGDMPLDLCIGEVVDGEGVDFPFDNGP
jgi:hypothetical protein